MPSSITHQTFVSKWRAATLTERSSYQQHLLDLCLLLNHFFPADVDSQGTFFTFEAGAEKQGGGQGWADVWYKVKRVYTLTDDQILDRLLAINLQHTSGQK